MPQSRGCPPRLTGIARQLCLVAAACERELLLLAPANGLAPCCWAPDTTASHIAPAVSGNIHETIPGSRFFCRAFLPLCLAELIATVPDEDRFRVFEAAEKSYLETAHELGYQIAEAQQWASAVMWQLRIEEDRFKGRMLTSPPTSPA